MEVTLVLVVGGAAAGLFGALLGLGGGILIVPLLTLGLGLPVREAVGVSLVCVVVTSGAAAGVYLQRHVANLRLGMALELFTASGALLGGFVAFLVSEQVIAGLFAALLGYTTLTMIRRGGRAADEGVVLDAGVGTPEDHDGGPLDGPGYRVHHVGPGVVGSLGAGIISALLGVGGGVVKVPLMHLAMGVPLRAAAATSNLMMGVTAGASAIIYLLRGGIDPWVAGPTAIGVFIGASIGARTAHRLDVSILRGLFVVVLLYTAFEMGRRALGLA